MKSIPDAAVGQHPMLDLTVDDIFYSFFSVFVLVPTFFLLVMLVVSCQIRLFLAGIELLNGDVFPLSYRKRERFLHGKNEKVFALISRGLGKELRLKKSKGIWTSSHTKTLIK